MRPRLFRIYEIASEGRNASPVVEPRLNEIRVVLIREIRRRLHVDFPQDDSRDGYGSGEVRDGRLRMEAHRDVGLGAKVLNDHFLDVSVPVVHLSYREERVDPLVERLPYADQYPGGEGDSQPPRLLDGLQAKARGF